MIGFLGRRLLTLGLTLWLASLVVFVVLEVSKLAISFWDYLGARLNIPDADRVPWLPDFIRQNASA